MSDVAAFAEAVLKAGRSWVGPPPAAIRAMGDKANAKAIATRAGVPVLPAADAEEVKSETKRQRQWREIGLGAQILRDLNVVSIRNLVSQPQAYVALSGFGIEISETEILE